MWSNINSLKCWSSHRLPPSQTGIPSWSIWLVLFVGCPWLRRLVTGLSPRRPVFDPGSVHVGFVVNKVALGQVLPRVLRFSPLNFIPPVLHYLEKWKKNTHHLHHRFTQ
jgi:hypothetical protein